MTESLQQIYDREQRRDVIYTGLTREVTPHVVRHVDPVQGVMSCVLYTQLDEHNADQMIQEQIDYFGERSFEWKYFSHDTPADLKERLAKHGFEVDEAEAILILDVQQLADSNSKLLQPITHDVRHITNPDEIHGIMTVQSRVFGNKDTHDSDEGDWVADQLTDELRTNPDLVSVYAAYAPDGVVASSAWVRFPEGNRFASLWGAATLPAYRGQGYYMAVLAARVQEAIERGRRFLTVDASPMSRPILERQGFQWVTTSYPCQWNGKKKEI